MSIPYNFHNYLHMFMGNPAHRYQLIGQEHVKIYNNDVEIRNLAPLGALFNIYCGQYFYKIGEKILKERNITVENLNQSKEEKKTESKAVTEKKVTSFYQLRGKSKQNEQPRVKFLENLPILLEAKLADLNFKDLDPGYDLAERLYSNSLDQLVKDICKDVIDEFNKYQQCPEFIQHFDQQFKSFVTEFIKLITDAISVSVVDRVRSLSDSNELDKFYNKLLNKYIDWLERVKNVPLDIFPVTLIEIFGKNVLKENNLKFVKFILDFTARQSEATQLLSVVWPKYVESLKASFTEVKPDSKEAKVESKEAKEIPNDSENESKTKTQVKGKHARDESEKENLGPVQKKAKTKKQEVPLFVLGKENPEEVQRRILAPWLPDEEDED